jgi:hypothetical protein
MHPTKGGRSGALWTAIRGHVSECSHWCNIKLHGGLVRMHAAAVPTCAVGTAPSVMHLQAHALVEPLEREKTEEKVRKKGEDQYQEAQTIPSMYMFFGARVKLL